MAWWYFKGRKLEQRGVLSMFNVFRNFGKGSPVPWFFFFAVIAIVVGLIITAFEFLIYLGGILFLIWIVYFIIWLKDNLP